MQAKDKAISALLAAFPGPETWKEFSQNNDNDLIRDNFLNLALRHGLIKTAEAKSLEAFILQHTAHRASFKPPKHLDFEELLDKKGEILGINISLRALTERINALLAEKQITLPKVTNSMLTRLKKEPVDTTYKQNVLRSLAFWLGHERAEIATDWHYETLLKICREGRQTENYKEGARIGFALYSRGDVIDHEILGWLRKALRNYIEQSISHFSYGRWGKVRAHDITTLYVDFPKEEAGDLVSYRQCLRSAVSLAHQMTIRWALSRYSTKNRFLSIAIVVGEFASLDNHLLPLLNAKLPDDPVIRISDYARQCMLINDIRVVLCPAPTETTLFNGEALTIWWVEALWSTLYFDFVSDLLEDPVLQTNPASVEKLNDLLWPADGKPDSEIHDKPNAIATFFKVPHNSLLGVEIAKTLYYRRRFYEALEILRVVLSINPTNLIARTLRMILLRNIALNAPTYDTSDGLFRQAKKEARFIQANCACESEEFYCEFALIYTAQALTTLRHIRSHWKLLKKSQNIDMLKTGVYECLDTAEDLFENGMVVSPSSIRSSYLLSSTQLLKAILKDNEDIFVNPKEPLTGTLQTHVDVAVKAQWQIGFRRSDLPEETHDDRAEKLVIANQGIHNNAVSLESYRATIYFCHAVALWDYLTVKNVAVIKRAQQFIRMAIEIAESLKKDDVCIYSFSRIYGEMITADEYIHHMQKCLHLIEETTGKNLYARKDHEIITHKGKQSSLMTLNF